VLACIFADERYFCVHDPVPASDWTTDEGAANHCRLATDLGAVHLFGWGRARGTKRKPTQRPARQAREASEAVARLLKLSQVRTVFWQQAPAGIDAGAFHSDVLCVGNDSFLMLHERAFLDHEALVAELRLRLGGELDVFVAGERELPLHEAVAAYPFNSQLVSLPGGKMAIVAPSESRDTASAHGRVPRLDGRRHKRSILR